MKAEKERFEEKIEPEPNSGCWLWTGFQNPLGYGMFRTYRYPTQPMELAHRVSFRLYIQEFDRSSHVLHRCDNPSCVNPGHLFLGTDADNARDREQKGRHHPCQGEQNSNASLTRDQVNEIRKRGRGRDQRGTRRKERLAEEFGVSLGQVRNICVGRQWKGLP